MRTFLRQLTSPAATASTVWIVSYGLFLLDDLPFLWADRFAGWPVFEQWVRSAALTTIAHVALVIVLLVARVTWLRSSVARRRPSVTVVTFIIATIVSSGVEALAGAMNASATVLLSVDGMIFELIALITVAVAVAAVTEQRRLLAELQQRRRELESLRTDGEAAIERVRADVIDVVRTQLRAVGGDVRRASDAIRQISHDLAFTYHDLTFAAPPTTVRPSAREVWHALALRPLLAPRLMATVMALLAVRSTMMTLEQAEIDPVPPTTGLAITVDNTSMGRALAVIAAVWVATYCATRLVAHLMTEAGQRAVGPLPWWLHGLSVVGAALLAHLLATVLVLIATAAPPPAFEWWMLGSYTVPVVAVAVVIGLVRAVERRAALTRDALGELLDRLQWDVARLNALARAERRSLAFLLHGSALRVIRAASSPEQDAPAEVLAVRVRDAVLQVLDDGDAGRGGSLQHRLDGLAREWATACDIQTRVDEAVHLAVVADPASTAALVDVVSEAVTNGVTHGHAAQVVVSIRLSDVDLVEITVEDVAPHAETARVATEEGAPGMGTRLFDELCVLWHRFPTDTGSRFQAWIPVDAYADAERESGLEGASDTLED